MAYPMLLHPIWALALQELSKDRSANKTGVVYVCPPSDLSARVRYGIQLTNPKLPNPFLRMPGSSTSTDTSSNTP